MHLEINENLGERFQAALKKSGEDEKKVVERFIKTYVYEVFSRNVETFFALETFMKLPGSK